MALTFVWKGYNKSTNNWDFEIGQSNVIAFYGANFGQPIQIGQYNDSMHIKLSTTEEVDVCAEPHLVNLKYISDNEVSIDGGSPVPLTSVNKEDMILIEISSDTPFSILDARFFFYQPPSVENQVENVKLKAFGFGHSQWYEPNGRQNAISLKTDAIKNDLETSKTLHRVYVGMSVSPLSTGASTLWVARIEVDIQ